MFPLHWLHSTYVIYAIVLLTYIHLLLEGQIISASPKTFQSTESRINKYILTGSPHSLLCISEKRKRTCQWEEEIKVFESQLYHMYNMTLGKLHNESGSPSVQWE